MPLHRRLMPALCLRCALVSCLFLLGDGTTVGATQSESTDLSPEASAALSAAREHSRQGRAREAVAEYRRALEDLPSGQPTTARVCIGLAVSLMDLAEFRQAEEALDRAERELARSDDLALETSLLHARATLASYRGDGERAVVLYQQTVEQAENGDLRALPVYYTNLAQALIGQHDYATAVHYLEEARRRDPQPRVATLAPLGICYIELNQLDAAEGVLGEALAVAKERGHPVLEAWVTGELGLVAQARGRLAEAEQAFDRAIALTRQAENPRDEVVWWMNKGRLYRDQQRYSEALPFYREAERLYGELDVVRVNPNLHKHIAQCLAGLGRDAEAEPLLHLAISEAREAGDDKVVWEALRELARLERRAGRSEAAGGAYLEALDVVESMRSQLRLEGFKTDFFSNKVGLYEETAAFLIEAGGDDGAARAFEVAERARARGFLDTLAESRARLHETLPASVLGRERELLDEISRLQASPSASASGAAPQPRLAELERELQNLYLEVRESFPRFRDLRGLEPASLGELQRALAPGEAVVAYLLSEPRSHLWWVDGESIRHSWLPGRDQVEGEAISAYASLVDAGARPDAPILLLGETLLGPLASRLEAISSLYIVPSGALYLFPFEVLSVQGTQLVDRVATAYLPSASTLVELRAHPISSATPGVLALADPRLGGRHDPTADGFDSRGPSATGFGSLPHARSEARRVARRFRGHATTLLGEAASERALKDLALDRYSVLHFATHGVIDASSPQRSGLVLAAEGGTGDGAEDGLLQPREILRLELGAELVTLSACRSAIGRLVTGEGMVGLTRSFFYAGADSVLASLWNVNDRASADFMGHFYEALATGAAKAEALQTARRRIRGTRGLEHPYYWAPFVLVGRGETSVTFPDGPAPLRERFPLVLVALAVGLLVAAIAVVAVFVSRRAR